MEKESSNKGKKSSPSNETQENLLDLTDVGEGSGDQPSLPKTPEEALPELTDAGENPLPLPPPLPIVGEGRGGGGPMVLTGAFGHMRRRSQFAFFSRINTPPPRAPAGRSGGVGVDLNLPVEETGDGEENREGVESNEIPAIEERPN